MIEFLLILWIALGIIGLFLDTEGGPTTSLVELNVVTVLLGPLSIIHWLLLRYFDKKCERKTK